MTNRNQKRIQNRIAAGAKTVADEAELLEEWDYSKNNCEPSAILLGSQQKIWWKCEICGHEWQTDPCHRMSGRGCPMCARKSCSEKLQKKHLIVGKTDLATVNPLLAAQWHPYKNGDLKPTDVTQFSAKKVWWLCNVCGNEWQSTISGRSAGNGCPKCARVYHSSKPEYAIRYYLQKFFPDIVGGYRSKALGRSELDIFIPSLNLGIEYDGAKWHQDIKRDIRKANLCSQAGITLVSVREQGCPVEALPCFTIYTGKPDTELLYMNSVIEELFLFFKNSLWCLCESRH